MKMPALFIHLMLTITLITSPACSKTAKKDEPEPEPIVHQAHLGRGWYEKDPGMLSQQVNRYLEQAEKDFPVNLASNSVKVIISPHAGYYFSGLCAATAYQTLLEENNLRNTHIDRVIILAPSHRMFFKGIALPHYTQYETPLGTIELDHDALNKLAKHDLFTTIGQAHEPEHSLETQLPFLQKTIKSFKLIPLIVGDVLGITMIHTIAAKLATIIDDNTLVVVSSDFMHYGKSFNYEFSDTKQLDNQIRHINSQAVKAITDQSLDTFQKTLDATKNTICGQNAIKVLLALIEQETFDNVQPHVTCYYTSEHLRKARNKTKIKTIELIKTLDSNDIDSTVSYVGMVFSSQTIEDLPIKDQLNGFEKRALLQAARETVENEYKEKSQQLEDYFLWPLVTPGMQRQAGAFVTINTKAGELKGCIGRIASQNPLFQTVHYMSIQAALHDTRFSPLKKDELDDIVFDITMLTPPKTVTSDKDIVIGKHGIVLKKYNKHGTLRTSAVYLPQVAPDQGWDLTQTLEQLSLKAGLTRSGWKEDVEIDVFEGLKFAEH